jgi:predicted MFS family arabinose efflux permease
MTIGVPLGSVIATLGNWRLPFLLVAALGAISFVGIAFGLPPAIPAVKTTMAQRFAIARRPGIPRALLMTYLWSGGMFTIFTYLAVFLDEHAGISGYALAASFVLFGAFGAVGNALGGRLADRLGSLRALRGALAVLAAAMAFLGGVAWLVPPAFATIPVLVGIAVWSVSGWCTNAPQASRLVGYASDAPAVALSLNASAMYLGTASGALLGSLILSLGASWQLGLAAALCQLLALATLSTGVAERSVRAAAGQSAE